MWTLMYLSSYSWLFMSYFIMICMTPGGIKIQNIKLNAICLYALVDNKILRPTTNDAPELIKFYTYNENKYITSIYSGRYFTIFANHASQTYFAVGYNLSGQCGVGNYDCIIKQLKLIEYFNVNNIVIKSIKISANGYNIFWITSKNQIYSHGPNRYSQLGLFDSDNNNITPISISDYKQHSDI
eukprot:436421_1